MNTDNATKETSNILVVDDTPENLALLVGMLKRQSYVVRPAPSGKLALQAAELQPPDLILLDINMPEMDGFEVCRQLKQKPRLNQVPVIFISALTETTEKIKAFEVGGVDYVTKPFQFEEVAARIETHLKLHRYQTIIESWNLQLGAKVREQTQEIRKQNEQLSNLVEKLKKNNDETIQAFSNLMELRNPGPDHHANHVADVSEKVAIAMGLPETANIRIAGLFHDIGKLGTPDAVLNINPANLPPEAYNDYKLHSIRSQAALGSIEALREAGLFIRHHHEAYNGSGFPDGLREGLIPQGAMIIGMADFLDWCIQSPTPVEDPIGFGLAKLQLELGKKFDPELFRWFADPVVEVYSRIIRPVPTQIVKEVSARELTPGMILARDVYSGTGIILLEKGAELNEHTIHYVRRMYQYDPPKSGIYVTKLAL